MQFIDLAAQQARILPQLNERIQSVLSHGKYIMGPEIAELEEELAIFSGARHVITCGNGTDALQLALMALGVGTNDAVFVPSFTFASTAEVAPLLGAVPVFVDVDPRTFNLDVESLKRAVVKAQELGLVPKVVVPVDLFGLPAHYDVIREFADSEGLKIIGDSAQGFGATYKGQKTGTLGDITTASFFPAKPLGCYGDGGAMLTDDDELAALLDSLRVHGKGHEKYDNVRIGVNSRLDTLQAAILLEKLAIYPDELEKRNRVAAAYTDRLSGLVETPFIPNECQSVWAQYTIKLNNRTHRDSVMACLTEQGIPSMVYYPLPLHQQTGYVSYPTDPQGCEVAADVSSRVLSLPMHAYLSDDEIGTIAEAVRNAI